MTLTGSCLCGSIHYESGNEPETTALCHCIDCQKWTGSAYTSNAVVAEDSFKVTKGTPKLFDIVAASGKINHKYFCGDCGSSLWTQLEVMPGKVLIKAGGLDNGGASLGNKIQVEFYCKDRVGYLQGVGGAQQDPQFG